VLQEYSINVVLLWVRDNTQGFPGYLQDISEKSILAIEVFSKVYHHGTSTFDAVNLALEAANMSNAGSFGAPGRDVSWRHIVDLRKASWFGRQRSLGVLKSVSAILNLR